MLLAAGLGAAVGVERELRQKAAGIRTNALIGFGAALFTVLSSQLVGAGGDPSRVAAQIVTGVGFIGAGVIMRSGAGVQGLTTAATIWANAAVGMAAGSGRYTLAIAGALTVLVVLTTLAPIDRLIDERRRRGGG